MRKQRCPVIPTAEKMDELTKKLEVELEQTPGQHVTIAEMSMMIPRISMEPEECFLLGAMVAFRSYESPEDQAPVVNADTSGGIH